MITLCCAAWLLCALLCLLSCMVETLNENIPCRHNSCGFLLQVSGIWSGATYRYELALRQVQQAIEMAEEQLAGQTAVC